MRWDQVAEWVGNPKLGAELGVMFGNFTAPMLDRFRDLRMVAVDLWAPVEGYPPYKFKAALARFREQTRPYRARLTTLRMETVAAAELFDDCTFDFVFIDACHEYDAVKADIAAWRSKVRVGGLLCGHDYGNKHVGVKPAVDELGLPVTTGADWTWMVRL